jgi:hypothetical protein
LATTASPEQAVRRRIAAAVRHSAAAEMPTGNEDGDEDEDEIVMWVNVWREAFFSLC